MPARRGEDRAGMSGSAFYAEGAGKLAAVAVVGEALVAVSVGVLLHVAGRARALAAVAIIGEALVLIAERRLLAGGRDVRAGDKRQAEHGEGHRGERKRLHCESPWRWTRMRGGLAEGRSARSRSSPHGLACRARCPCAP